jgi:hypothetical protein
MCPGWVVGESSAEEAKANCMACDDCHGIYTHDAASSPQWLYCGKLEQEHSLQDGTSNGRGRYPGYSAYYKHDEADAANRCTSDTNQAPSADDAAGYRQCFPNTST